ncbi:tyrosine-type recombinase/integrase [Nocardia cyriacigeorgica]|uniref:Tyrosine-type recombinase/integrase n=2 Tax=Nocardia cyriacigeorgica TaxID=135487 RepID=A0A6P1CWR2_9NOCA|nr:site-specific integrase [Nocardia cyriacigeorgica]MBF6497407.1 tyrosine-type recombinase/integrase [Nocardia cyriacigeorgica]NEW36103.1 tyrosine-type recombinase/integrase [Nocardia cyriacigeorgica]
MMTNDDVATALHLIARMGLRIEDLAAVAAAGAVSIPTFGEYIPIVRAAVPKTTSDTYDSYWRIIENFWPDRPISDPTATEIERLVHVHRGNAVRRSNSREGRAAVGNFLSAFRCLYKHAERDRLIHPLDNPAARVRKPRQLPSLRHALTVEQVQEIAHVAANGGNDPELDALIVRIHIETACRRNAAVRLEAQELDVRDCLVKLREKGGIVRWHPISPTLMDHLTQHIERRGGFDSTPRVLRYRNGSPISRRRYDTLSNRIRRNLPWAEALGVTAHWIRHTTITWVEREFGLAIARAFAGHIEPNSHPNATFTYVRPSLVELAEAVSVLTGEPHPLARAQRHPLAPRHRPYDMR